MKPFMAVFAVGLLLVTLPFRTGARVVRGVGHPLARLALGKRRPTAPPGAATSQAGRVLPLGGATLGLGALVLVGIGSAIALLVVRGDPNALSASAVVKRGEGLYKAECLSCHGLTGERLPLAPLSSKDFLSSRGDATLLAVITEGKGTMPAFGKIRGGPFNDDEVRAVVAYLNSKAGRESTSLLADAGKQLFASNCSQCHGVNGDRIPIAPLGAKGFLDTKTDGDLQEVIRKGKGPMPAFAVEAGGKLSDVDVGALVAFLRHRVDERTALTASRGRELYLGNCLQCHGAEGNRVPNVALGSAPYLESLGDGGLISAISQGKGFMPAFGTGTGGSMDVPDIASLLVYLKTWAGVSATSALVPASMAGSGRDLFLRNCTGCHGATGDQVPGVKLFSKEFLARETDAVLLQTIARGNAKGMPAWSIEAGGPLIHVQIRSILDFLKSSAVSEAVTSPGPGPALPGATPTAQSTISMTQQAIARGKEIFETPTQCVMCHGATRDKIATARLDTAAFLQERGDEALIQSITFGKGAMPAWGTVRSGPLSADDVKAVIAYLKNAAGIGEVEASTPNTTPAGSADLVAKGQDLFNGTCAMCHGQTRDKVPTCPLANPQWLQAKGFDGVGRAVTLGKPPMMPAWGKAQGGPLSEDDIKAIVTYLWDAAGLGEEIAGAVATSTPSADDGGGQTSAPPTATPGSLSGPITPSVAVGKQVFTTTCAMCHGQAGLNIANCPLGSREWLSNMSLEGLMGRIRRGKPTAGMPSWGQVFGGPLSEEEILSVAMYLGEMAR